LFSYLSFLTHLTTYILYPLFTPYIKYRAIIDISETFARHSYRSYD